MHTTPSPVPSASSEVANALALALIFMQIDAEDLSDARLSECRAAIARLLDDVAHHAAMGRHTLGILASRITDEEQRRQSVHDAAH